MALSQMYTMTGEQLACHNIVAKIGALDHLLRQLPLLSLLVVLHTVFDDLFVSELDIESVSEEALEFYPFCFLLVE